ncbi:Nif3-like dinuclear metal center hexameric protein [Gottfriedia luciferensis]|uniref:Nif3-like dinuclear metal center hexameric protein n=1 Tax=Gottfriedia luciferensis TaxID=178774 RepID=UPI000B441685|nr:Nif3-like dinuclear metal center hexameric protein [Gottfriedia luciferensis]
MKAINGFQFVQQFEELFPKHLAEEGDPNGLQIGTLSKQITKVLIALDVTKDVVEEAIAIGANLIIAHHPIIYRPLKKIDTDSEPGKIVELCIKHDIAVFAAHTNVDIAEIGVSDFLAEALQLENTSVLAPTYVEKLIKLVVYVPKTHVEVVRDALCKAGAGHIGNYSHCTFNSDGTGTFMPLSGTTPFIGQQGQLEEVEEVKVETIVPELKLKNVLKSMHKAHPYEEVAYDTYVLNNEGKTYGIGRIGSLKEELSLEEFAHYVKEKLDLQGVRVVGNLNDKVKKVAIVGGDGNKFAFHAKRNGADVYLSGDIYYHVAQDWKMLNLNIVDAGHNIEKVMKLGVKHLLDNKLKEKNMSCEIVASSIHTDPFTFI